MLGSEASSALRGREPARHAVDRPDLAARDRWRHDCRLSGYAPSARDRLSVYFGVDRFTALVPLSGSDGWDLVAPDPDRVLGDAEVADANAANIPFVFSIRFALLSLGTPEAQSFDLRGAPPGFATLDQGRTVAAGVIPEPSGFALIISGLLLIGAIRGGPGGPAPP